MLQSKDIDWLNRLKNKIYMYAAYKKLTSELKTPADCKWEDGKKVFHANENEKKNSSSSTYIRQNRL